MFFFPIRNFFLLYIGGIGIQFYCFAQEYLISQQNFLNSHIILTNVQWHYTCIKFSCICEVEKHYYTSVNLSKLVPLSGMTFLC